MKSFEKKLNKIWDRWMDRHIFADFHGIDTYSLWEDLIKLARQADKKIDKGFGEEHING